MLIDETALTSEMHHRIEPCNGISLRCDSNIRVKPLGQLHLYLYLRDLIVRLYFAFMPEFPQKLISGTTFWDRDIENTTPTDRQISPRNYHPTLALNNEKIREIYKFSALKMRPDKKRTSHPSTYNKNRGRMVSLTPRTRYHPIDESFRTHEHPKLYHNLNGPPQNGIIRIEKDKKFFFWVLNMSDQPKKLPLYSSRHRHHSTSRHM